MSAWARINSATGSTTDSGPNNLAVLRHMALNLIAKDKSKGSLPKKLRRAALNDAFLATLLAQIT